MSTQVTCERSSASQKVLTLPELVLPTIKDLAPRDLHSAALVCHTWSGIALNYLWETALSPAPLFNTLAPMRYSEEESNWTFVTDLSQAKWSRFHSYAQRIRIVEIYTPKKRWSQPVSVDSVEIVQVSMPSGYHFPRPVRLLSHDPLALGSAGPSLYNFLYTVSTKIKELYVSEVHHIGLDIDDAPVQVLFRRFGELEAPSLESITLRNPVYLSNSPSLPHLIKRHASTISSLELHVPFNEQLWTAIRGLHQLKEFTIDLGFACQPPSSPRDTIMALDDITSRMFPKLEVLSVDLPYADVDTAQRRLEVFKCISGLTQLTSLTMRSITPIMPYADQMWHLGQSLYQLETLCIDVGPLARGETSGTSTSLISILQSFPRIKRLETSISCDSIPGTTQIEVHSSLEVLDLSWSPAPKARQEEVVGFLKSILPRTARVVYMGEEEAYGVGAGKAAWAEVARLMDEA
ncbi:hypothetical protein M407DRAFT_20605 [Tulasnella calospora MUT 4182]|uniref:F-box domain-containing protein n=1 Tax=Tulasnella calospora MUT 4182 TaxID=1051891 RepID=A0A0C3QPS1_9AGAM|nr:hypothetical protein M407DRAFT_20605 [Tulasnella calospora MUT 4182]